MSISQRSQVMDSHSSPDFPNSVFSCLDPATLALIIVDLQYIMYEEADEADEAENKELLAEVDKWHGDILRCLIHLVGSSKFLTYLHNARLTKQT